MMVLRISNPRLKLVYLDLLFFDPFESRLVTLIGSLMGLNEDLKLVNLFS